MTINTTQLLTAAQAASYLNLNYDSLRRLKRSGLGPRCIQLSARASFYLRADLDAFLASRRA
jgi:hypothetical protein